MKLSDDMLYAHPVLLDASDANTDYTSGAFSFSAEVAIDDDQLRLSTSLSVTQPEIVELINQGLAACGYYLICQRTYYNKLNTMPLGDGTQHYDITKFFGAVKLQPVVWTRESVKDYTSTALHAEYGGNADLPPAAIIAIGPEQKFSVDRHRYRPFETIFVLAAHAEVPRGEIRVDPDYEKIKILTHSETKSNLEEIRDAADGKALLLNAIYLPAVIGVLQQLRGGDGNLTSKAWYRTFSAKCDARNIDMEHDDPLTAAQSLLESPFQRIADIKERLFS